MQLRPRSRLWVIALDPDDTDGEGWIHLPTFPERTKLDYEAAMGKAHGNVAESVCGITAEAGEYVADEYLLDVDWCDECKAAVEADREVLDMLKSVDLDDLFKDIKVSVPTRIVRTPRSKSRDRI